VDSRSEPENGKSQDAAALLVPSRALVPAPVGGDPARVNESFDSAVGAEQAEFVRLSAPMPPRLLATVGPAHLLPPLPCHVAARSHGLGARRMA
jgi:hypothetical protein